MTLGGKSYLLQVRNLELREIKDGKWKTLNTTPNIFKKTRKVSRDDTNKEEELIFTLKVETSHHQGQGRQTIACRSNLAQHLFL